MTECSRVDTRCRASAGAAQGLARGWLTPPPPPHVAQLNLDDSDFPLGPGGTRAICSAYLGSTGALCMGGPFKLLKTLRMWRCNIGDDGAAAVAEMLENGAPIMALSYIDLMDNRIGPRGCEKLGEALSCLKVPSKVVTLNLQYNDMIGCEGVMRLGEGLRSNNMLKQLHLSYCNVGADGALAIAQVLAFPNTLLKVVNLQGNQIGNDGLVRLSNGIRRTKTLTELNLQDNRISGEVDPLMHFAQALNVNKSLVSINLLFNKIGIAGARALQPALAPKAEGAELPNEMIKQFKVDASLPDALFVTLFRDVKEKKGKKGKKGKKKK